MICVQEEIIDIKCCGPIERVGFIYGNAMLSISLSYSGLMDYYFFFLSVINHQREGYQYVCLTQEETRDNKVCF